jgi:glutathione S-transferase
MKNSSIQGVNPILLALCKMDPQSSKFIGKTPEQRALTRQWLEYNISCLVGNSHHSANLLRVTVPIIHDVPTYIYSISCVLIRACYFMLAILLQELDFALIPYTFFTGNTPTIADLLIYFSLYPTFVSPSPSSSVSKLIEKTF